MAEYATYVRDGSDLDDRIDTHLTDDESVSSQMNEWLDKIVPPADGKRHTVVYPITVELTPFKATCVGNRLWMIAETQSNDEVEDETKWLARRFHAAVQEADDDEVLQVELSEFEARVVGNRLHEAGEKQSNDSMAGESWMLRDLFHERINTRS